MTHRWKCPVCDGAVLAPSRPRRNDVRRYCLACSAKTGRLVERFCPIQSAARDRRREKNLKKLHTAAEKAAAQALEYPEVLKLWAAKWRDLKAWDDLEVIPTELIVRRGTKKHTSGHAWPVQPYTGSYGRRHSRGRITLTAGTDGADALATLLHEMAHLRAGPNQGHGAVWRSFFLLAAEEVTGKEIAGPLANKYSVHEAVAVAMKELADNHKLGSEEKPRPVREVVPRSPKNRTKYRSLDAIAADPRVEEIWDEGTDGIWIALVEGYNHDGCSAVHEWSVKDLIKSFHDGVTEGAPS